ncbi:MAG: ABC transporter substrate-binding protein [Clostridiaceae bacterium]
MKKKILSLVLASLFTVSLTACSSSADKSKETATSTAKEKKVVRLGFPGTSNSLGGVAGVAQQKKYFEEELEKVGYTVEYVPFAALGPAVNEALAGNKVDVAIYADFPGLVLKSKGIDIDLLGIAEDKIHSRMIVKSDSNISSVKELKGKKIGFTKGTYMQKFLLQLLAENGLADKDVELINLTSDAESALISGNVDALVLTDSSALQLIADKKVAKEIENTRNHPSWSAQSVFVGSHNFAKENSDSIVAIDKALLKAKEYFKSNPDDSYQLLTAGGLKVESIKEIYKNEAPNFDLFTVKVTDDSVKRLEETQKFMIEQSLISKEFDTSKWVDNSYYEKAVK